MPQSLIGALSLALVLLVLPSGSRSQTSSSCSDVTTTQCLRTIVPFPEYNEAFPVIEYCLHHTRGFIATTRDNCLETGAGNWTTRPGNFAYIDPLKGDEQNPVYSPLACDLYTRACE